MTRWARALGIASRAVLGVTFLVAAACASAESSDSPSDDSSAPGVTAAQGASSATATQGPSGVPAGAGSEAGWTPPPGINLVVHTRLAAFIPTLPGWPSPRARGETDWPTLVTRVYADYDRGEDRLELELMDSVKSPNVMAPLTELMASDAAAADAGFVRTKIGRFPGVEEWTPEARNGTVTVLVADRFTVKFTGSTVASLNVIRDAVAKVELEKLATLK